jgi:aspartate 1-decarboxylase
VRRGKLLQSFTLRYGVVFASYRRYREGIIMQLNMLKGKIHRAIVTQAELHYEGSCAIDALLLEASGIREYEAIDIYNVSNGERFSTYAIRGEPGSGIISINGAAAHRAQPGHIIIIAAYAHMSESEAATYKPKLCYVDAHNRVVRTNSSIAEQSSNLKAA